MSQFCPECYCLSVAKIQYGAKQSYIIIRKLPPNHTKTIFLFFNCFVYRESIGLWISKKLIHCMPSHTFLFDGVHKHNFLSIYFLCFTSQIIFTCGLHFCMGFSCTCCSICPYFFKLFMQTTVCRCHFWHSQIFTEHILHFLVYHGWKQFLLQCGSRSNEKFRSQKKSHQI